MRVRWFGLATLFLLFVFSLAAPGWGQQAQTPATESGNQGDSMKAPDFELPGSDGKTYSLAQYAGKQPVVLAWFPKAFTGG